MTAVFDINRCAHVAKTVWRGNLPLRADSTFADGELRNLFHIPDTSHYIVVSLIDNVNGSERDPWLTEMGAFHVNVADFFPQNRDDIPPQFNQTDPPFHPGRCFLHSKPKPRSIMWWQIEGGDNEIVLGPSSKSYNFIGLMERMGELCERGIPVYVHCMNGTDRTGAVVAGFALRYLNSSLEEAFKLANSVKAAGMMNDDYRALVRAYARHLEPV